MSSEIPDPPEIEVVIEVTIAAINVPKPHLFFLSLSPVSLSLEGILGTSATDDFDLFNLCLVYILIMYGVLLVPSPVTLVVDLREIEGRTPLAKITLLLSKMPLLP